MSFPESSSEIVAIGDLFKMAKGQSRIWTYRKFFLSGIYLTYVDEAGKIKGRVNINGCTIRRMTANECQNPMANFAFGLFTNRSNQRCLMCAANEKERTLWISVLEDQIYEFQDSTRHYLLYNEVEIGTSLVTNLSITSNEANYRLVLTNLPRLLLIDPKSGVFKEQILFTPIEPPILRLIDDLSFHIKYKAQEWRFSDIRGSSYWVGIFSEFTSSSSNNNSGSTYGSNNNTSSNNYLYQPKPRQPRVIGEVMISKIPTDLILRSIHMYHKYPEYIPSQFIPAQSVSAITNSTTTNNLTIIVTTTITTAIAGSSIMTAEEERRRNELLLDNLFTAQKMDGKIYGKNNNNDDGSSNINDNDNKNDNTPHNADEDDDRWGDIEVSEDAGITTSNNVGIDGQIQYADIIASLLKRALNCMKEVIVLLSVDMQQLSSESTAAITASGRNSNTTTTSNSIHDSKNKRAITASNNSMNSSNNNNNSNTIVNNKKFESATLLFKTITKFNDSIHNMIRSGFTNSDGSSDNKTSNSTIGTLKAIDVIATLAAIVNDTQNVITGIKMINTNLSNMSNINCSTNNKSIRASSNNIRSSSSPQRKLGLSRNVVKNLNSSINRSNNNNSILMLTDKIYFLHVICNALNDVSVRIEATNNTAIHK